MLPFRLMKDEYFDFFQSYIRICNQNFYAINLKTNKGIQSRKFSIQGSRKNPVWEPVGSLTMEKIRNPRWIEFYGKYIKSIILCFEGQKKT